MDGPLAPMLFPNIAGVVMHPTAACAPPPTFVLIDPRCSEFSVRFDHAGAAPQPAYQYQVIQ